MGSIHNCIDCICSKVKYLEQALDDLASKVAKIDPSPTPPTPVEAGSLAGVSVKISNKARETIDLNGYLEFNETILNNTNGAVEISTEDDATIFTLTKAGTYYFSWQLSVDGYVMRVSPEVNGTIIPASYNQSQNTPIVGTEIIVVDDIIPTTVKLINNGRSSFRFSEESMQSSVNILCQIAD